MNFKLQIGKFVKDTERRINDLIGAVFLDMSSRIIELTPVDTGAARNNWFPSFNNPSNETTLKRDRDGGTAMARVNSFITTDLKGTTLYLTNNLPYILHLENGHSQQSSEMVSQTIRDFKNTVFRLVK